MDSPGRLHFATGARGALHVRSLILVAAGGAAGAILRDVVIRSVGSSPDSFPSATTTANLVGAFVLGVLHAAVLPSRPHLRPLVAVGFLGAFTTFSGFTVGVVDLLRHDEVASSAVYLATTVVGGLVAAWFGIRLGSRLARRATPRP